MPRLRSRVRDSFPAPVSLGSIGCCCSNPAAVANGFCSPMPTQIAVCGYNTSPWRGSKVVMQRPAKPFTPVRSRPPPPVFQKSAACAFFVSASVACLARVVKLVDTADLKSAAYPRGGVPVRFRSRAPKLQSIVRLQRQASFFSKFICFPCHQGLAIILHLLLSHLLRSRLGSASMQAERENSL